MRYILGPAAPSRWPCRARHQALPSPEGEPPPTDLSRGIDPDPLRPRDEVQRRPTCFAGTLAMVDGSSARLGRQLGRLQLLMWGKHGRASTPRAVHRLANPSSMAFRPCAGEAAARARRDGNIAALARRIGIQGLIFEILAHPVRRWDGQLGPDYSYATATTARAQEETSIHGAHMNHVHIDLNNPSRREEDEFWDEQVSYPLETQDPAPHKPGTGSWTPPCGNAMRRSRPVRVVAGRFKEGRCTHLRGAAQADLRQGPRGDLLVLATRKSRASTWLDLFRRQRRPWHPRPLLAGAARRVSSTNRRQGRRRIRRTPSPAWGRRRRSRTRALRYLTPATGAFELVFMTPPYSSAPRGGESCRGSCPRSSRRTP